MKAVRRTENGIETVDAPIPDGDGLRVHVRAAGICGSDVHALRYGASPVTLGHEFGGVLDDGTPVAVKPNVHCGRCTACLRGEENLCRDATRKMYGITLDGGMAEQVIVRAENVLPLPPGLPPELLALVEPISIAVHGAHRAQLEPGMKVLIIGAGSIGLSTVMAARWMGVDVDVVARHPHQQAAADALGGRLVVEQDYDVVIDSVGSQPALDDALRLVRYGGTVAEVGGWWDPVQLGVLPMLKELTIVNTIYAAHHHGNSEFAQAAAVLERSHDAVDVLVTHRFPLELAAEAFATAADRSLGAIKVQLHPA
jgi:threonine dehydrogenase-like Zn-dependent dehydrogenase